MVLLAKHQKKCASCLSSIVWDQGILNHMVVQRWQPQFNLGIIMTVLKEDILQPGGPHTCHCNNAMHGR